MASLLSPCDNLQSTRGRSERIQFQAKMAAWNSFSYICTSALHSFRSFANCRAASTVIPLLPKATFTPSIQPKVGLPRTRPPLTSAINTLLAIRYSSILSTCPNHLNTLWSALLANSLSIQLSYASSFLTLSIRVRNETNQTSHTLHLKNIHFPSLSTSHTPCLCSVQRRWYNCGVRDALPLDKKKQEKTNNKLYWYSIAGEVPISVRRGSN